MWKKQIALLMLPGLLIFGFVATSCQSSSKTAPVMSAWDTYKKDFFADLWQTFPSWATSQGLAQYSEAFKIPNAAYKQERLAFYNKYNARLAGIQRSTLPTLDRMDYELLQNYFNASLWEETTFKTAEWDPSQYNIGAALAAVLENGALAEDVKLRRLISRLALAPEYYEAGFNNITVPTKEYTDYAIAQNTGLLSYLEEDIKARFEKSSLSAAEKAQGAKNIAAAAQAVRGYVAKLTELEKTLQKKKGFRSFRIGKTLYAQKFKFDLLSSYSAEEMYLKAVKAKQDLHKEMLTRAKGLWPKYFGKQKMPASSSALIRKVLERLADDHVQPEQFVSAVEKLLPQIQQFIIDKDLVTLDPTKPLKVRETPVYERGFAGASVDSPGPFDPKRETFFNVTPLTGMTPDKQQNYLREYNNYTLQILNIHEALPGHYVQLIYNSRSPSLVKSIFGNNALVEGWAVYGERMMMEEGYGGNSPELWLMYDKWRMRIICNTILDYSLHSLNMSKESALSLLRNEAFQEETQIEEKWNRATYSQVQLASYFTGFTEIYGLREDLKKILGSEFDLKHFNESFLGYGSSPVKFIREEMLKDPKGTSGKIAAVKKGAKS